MQKTKEGSYLAYGNELDTIEEWMWMCIMEMSISSKLKFIYMVITNKPPKVGIFKEEHHAY